MGRNGKKTNAKVDLAKDLWISPRLNLRGPDGNRGFDNRGNISPTSGARFLELGDIALGNKEPCKQEKRAGGGRAPGPKARPLLSLTAIGGLFIFKLASVPLSLFLR